MGWVVGIAAGLNLAGLAVLCGLVWHFHSKQIAALSEQAGALKQQKALVEEQKKAVEEQRDLLGLFSASRFRDELVALEELYERKLARLAAKLDMAQHVIDTSQDRFDNKWRQLPMYCLKIGPTGTLGSAKEITEEEKAEIMVTRVVLVKHLERARSARSLADTKALELLVSPPANVLEGDEGIGPVQRLAQMSLIYRDALYACVAASADGSTPDLPREAQGDEDGQDPRDGRMPGPQQHLPPSPDGKQGGHEQFEDS